MSRNRLLKQGQQQICVLTLICSQCGIFVLGD